jgi:hypothetical protein
MVDGMPRLDDIYISFWRMGLIASRRQIADAIASQFPYSRTSFPGEICHSLRNTSDPYECLRNDISCKVLLLFDNNLFYHERLFEPVQNHGIHYDRTPWRVIGGYEAQAFESFGVPDKFPQVLKQHSRFIRLPPDILLQIFEKYFNVRGKLLSLGDCRGFKYDNFTEPVLLCERHG